MAGFLCFKTVGQRFGLQIVAKKLLGALFVAKS
jgi:hypothetical protein